MKYLDSPPHSEMSFLVLLLTALILSFFWCYFHFKNKYQYWQNRGIKSIQPTFPFGNLLPIFTKKLGFTIIRKWYESIDGKAVGIYALDEPILLIKDPDILKLVLVKDFNYFTDRGVYIDKREPTAGHLWKLPGHKWRPLRAKMTPCFSLGKLKMMFSILVQTGIEMEKYLETKNDSIVNISEISERYSNDVIASSIFGIDINSFKEKNNEYNIAIDNLFKTESRIRIIKSVLQMLLPKFFDILTFQTETVNKKVNSFVQEMVEKVISFREETGTFRNDMMQLLMQLKDHGKLNNDGTSDEQPEENNALEGESDEMNLTMDEVVAQAYTYFFAGSETSTLTLTFLFYEVALNESIQKRLQEDIDRALKAANGEISYESILEMKYLNMVILETLRKYPVLPFLQRRAVSDYTVPELGNLKIEKGTRILCSVDGLQWDPKYYPEPEKFDPERFSKENDALRPSTLFLAFGDGPRNCIGKRLGHFMVAVGAVFLFKKFNLSICDKTNIPMKFNKLSITTKPLRSVDLKLTKRLSLA